MYVMLPRTAERLLVALATCPAGEWLRAAQAQADALQDARVALAAASLRRAIERASERDAALFHEVERRVERVLSAVASHAQADPPLTDDALACLREATLTAVGAVALRARLKPLDVALLTSAFEGIASPEPD